MLTDVFLPNLAIFLAGLGTAFFWMRTGMVRRGVLLLAVLTVAADVTIVARFVFGDEGSWFAVPLLLLQAAGLGAVAWLLFARARRRWSADSVRGRERIAQATRHYLRDELAPAAALYARVRRADPWNVPATIGLANVLWQQGRTRRALALWRRARRLDRGRGFADFVAEQVRRCRAGLTPSR